MSAQLPLRTCWVSGAACWGGGAERGFHYSVCARVTPGRGSRAADREREPRLGRPTAVDVLGSRALPHSPLRADSALLFRSCVRFSVSSLSSDIRREASWVAGRLCPCGDVAAPLDAPRGRRSSTEPRGRVGPRRPTRLPSLRGAGPPRPRAPPFSGMPCRSADAAVSALKHCREDSQGASCSGSPAKG